MKRFLFMMLVAKGVKTHQARIEYGVRKPAGFMKFTNQKFLKLMTVSILLVSFAAKGDPVKNINNVEYGDLQHDLIEAIENKKGVESVRSILDKGADPNGEYQANPSVQKQLPLVVAVQTGDSAVVKLLIERKADVNNESYDLVTPLIMAVKTVNNGDIIKLLLSAHASIYGNREPSLGNEMIVDIAVQVPGNLVNIRCLHEQLNFPFDKETLRLAASLPNNKDVLNYLISQGSPVGRALINVSDMDTLDYLVKTYHLDLNGDEPDLTPLMSAIMNVHQDLSIFNELLALGTDPNFQSPKPEFFSYQSRPLRQVIWYGKYSGTGPNVYHQTSVYISMLKTLVSYHVNLNAEDKSQDKFALTALMDLVTPSQPLSAEVSNTGGGFNLPFQVAAIQILINNGADLNIKNKLGKTAYDLAVSNHAPEEILKLLRR